MSDPAGMITLMNKFDAAGFEKMMARIQAESEVPGDGPMTEFSAGEAPQVRVGDIHGRAIAYTWHHGLVEWTDSRSKYHYDWFDAELIKRVPAMGSDSNTLT